VNVTVVTDWLPSLAEAAGGKKRLTLEVEGGSVASLLEALVRTGGEAVERALLRPDGTPDPHVQILVNGRDWMSPGVDRPLGDGDTVTFTRLVAGG
jgi:molybdopterin converting factor small subunit